MIRLYQTIRKNGRYFLRGYTIEGKKRKEFSLMEISCDAAFARLKQFQDEINFVRSGGKCGETRDQEKRTV